MAFQPKFLPTLLVGTTESPHTLELFLDYVCPFSAKMAKSIESNLKPLLGQGGQYEGKVKVIFRPQVQPWHVASTLTHESALAVLRVSPERYWDYSVKLFERQEDYFDTRIADLTVTQIREKLVELALTVVGTDKRDALTDLLTFKSTPNGGVAVTDDLKYTVKFARQNSIHVSPTALWDGIVANEVSSSWGKQEWDNFFKAKITT